MGKEMRSIAYKIVESLNLPLAIITNCSCNFWQTAELAGTIETE
jgi:hypothetical protein